MVRRSVLRRSWPKLESQLLVRSIGQRIPSGHELLRRCGAAGANAAADEIGDPDGGDEASYDAVVVAAVEMQGLGVVEHPSVGDGVERGGQEDAVVAVGAVRGPAHRDAVPVGEQGPLPT